MRNTLLLHAVGWWLLAPATAHAATASTDPTRPPGFTQAASTPAARGGVDGSAAVRVPVRPALQSLQVSAQGGSSALVDGRVVRIGDRLGETGEMAVVAIDAEGILLRGPRYDQRLALVPGGGKTASTAAANTSAITAASAGHVALLTAPLTKRPAPAVSVAPKEPR